MGRGRGLPGTHFTLVIERESVSYDARRQREDVILYNIAVLPLLWGVPTEVRRPPCPGYNPPPHLVLRCKMYWTVPPFSGGCRTIWTLQN